MKIATFAELHHQKLRGKMKKFAEKNLRKGDIVKFCLWRDNKIYIIRYIKK